MQPIYISQTRNAMVVAISFFIVFMTLLSGILFVDGLATWWFLLIIVGISLAFYFVSLYTFVRMEFYDESVFIRHLLKPRNAQQIRWEDITSISISHTHKHPYRVSVIVKGRKSPFNFTLMHENDEVRGKVLNAFREKGVMVRE